jgi:hypothetical protein
MRSKLIYLISVTGLWLVPFFYTGWLGRPISMLPKSLSFQHSAAGLFTQKTTRWWDQHLEIQKTTNERLAIDEARSFQMGAFGFRSRLDRILIESNRSPQSAQVRQRLAEHVFKTNAEARTARALRLVRSFWTVGLPEMAEAAGEWNPPPVHLLPEKDRQTLGTYVWRNDECVELQRQQGPRLPNPAKPGVPVAVKPAPPVPNMAKTGGTAPLPPASNRRKQLLDAMKANPSQPGSNLLPKGKLGMPGVPVVRKPAETQVPPSIRPAPPASQGGQPAAPATSTTTPSPAPSTR